MQTAEFATQQQIHETEARYRFLAESLPHFVWVSTVNGNVEYSNPHALDYMGLRSEPHAGEGWRNAIFADDLPALLRKREESVRTRQPFEIELRIRRASDGAYRWHLVRCLVFEQEGKWKWLGTALDIHDRKEAEQTLGALERELTAANERLRLVQRAVKAGSWEIPFDTGLLAWSPELRALYGAREDQDLRHEKEWIRFIYPEDRERVSRAVSEAMAVRGELRIQYRATIGGDLRWLTAFGCVVDGQGPLRMVGITIDTTEFQRREEAVRDAARFESIGRLAGGVAHDFNNLLAGIMGGASFIADIIPEQHAARPMLDLVVRSSERAAQLTQQLLAYSGKSTFTLRECDVSKTVQDAFPLLRSSVPQNIELVVQTGWKLPSVSADANKLREILLILVTNAAEAIDGREGAIWIRTGVERLDAAAIDHRFPGGKLMPGRYVHLDVTDDGAGIPKEIQKRIFEPFFTTKFMGRGLGLSAVEGIVRGHEGAIELCSEPGAQTAFRILLPVHTVIEEKRVETNVGGRPVILAIDDEEAIRNIVRAKLEYSGYTVLTAPDGLSGLEALGRHRDKIALVLLDVGLPKMSGSDVFDCIVRSGIDVPIVITSGYAEGEALSRIGSHRVAGFLQKPFNVRDLSTLVDRLLR